MDIVNRKRKAGAALPSDADSAACLVGDDGQMWTDVDVSSPRRIRRMALVRRQIKRLASTPQVGAGTGARDAGKKAENDDR